MRIIKYLSYYALGLVGILLVSNISSLFTDGLNFDITNYAENLLVVIRELVHPTEWTIKTFNYTVGGLEQPLLSYLGPKFLYSMCLLIGAFFLSLVIGMTLAITTKLCPPRIQTWVKKGLNTLEAFPDVIFIFLLQLFVVWFYKQFGYLIFEFAYLGEEKIYVAPILSLSLLPSVLFFKIILLLLDEEWTKDYTSLAKSKGFSKATILWRHCIRNIWISVFYHSKTIIWLMLSSLFMIEYFFNIRGFVYALSYDPSPLVSFIALTMIFTPFFILFSFLGNRVEHPSFKQSSLSLLQNQPLFNSRRRGVKPMVLIRNIATGTLISMKNISRHFKSITFCLSVLYITGFVGISFYYTLFKDNPISEMKYFETNSGLKGPPFSPIEPFLLGSDANGFSILDQLIVGAKYTIMITLLIAFLRVFVGYILSFPFLFFLHERGRNIVSKMADGIQFLPISIVAFIILKPLITNYGSGWALSFYERLFLEVFLLVVLVLPLVMNVLGSEMIQVIKNQYVQSSIVLGASKMRVFFLHVTPHMLPRMVHMFGVQVIQTLQVLLHLGVFSVFLGGTIFKPNEDPISYTHEWAGMIANMREAVVTGKYWLVGSSLVCYILLIISVQVITKKVIVNSQKNVGIGKQ
ncbi:ABC transporter permease subunit [Pontibacillus yanchengensis]|uniref:ABC transporter permease subunit n=1 Tax=Pontibacillus yanchengensis TaxID=462910 RepID=A0A6I4ZXS3_9BACI|nr:ABC transporter permease subunit [Pontibacillus yanchengensis]MYL34965.1 ABC transporter permease subunit [Pontibacillus yanchengensis]